MWRLAAAVAAFAVLASPAHAQTVAAIDQILTAFQGKTAAWQGGLRTAAISTFGILAGLQFAWAMIRAAWNKHDMAEWLGELVNQAIFIGFFSFLLLNAVTVGTVLIAGFRYAAGLAGGVGTSPGEVVAIGINLADHAAKGIADLPYSQMPGAIICCLVLLVLFAFMAAKLLTVVAKSFFWISAGVFMFGFGGSAWTKEYAISMIRHVVAVGFELFTLQLLMSLCMAFIQDWVANPQAVTLTSLFVQIACALVMTVLVFEIPREAQAMITGSAVSGPGLVAATAQLAAGVAVAGAAMAGAGVALTQAVRVAEAKIKSADAKMASSGGDTPERSRLGHAAALAGGTLNSLVGAGASDVGRRLSGQGARHGSAPWRMAADLGNQARLLSDDAGAPVRGGGASASPAPRGGQNGGAGFGAYQPWMSQSGGFPSLSPEHQTSAKDSYARWEQTNPEAAARHDLGDYVAYVQDKQAEREGRA